MKFWQNYFIEILENPCTSSNCEEKGRCARFNPTAKATNISNKLSSILNNPEETCVFYLRSRRHDESMQYLFFN